MVSRGEKSAAQLEKPESDAPWQWRESERESKTQPETDWVFLFVRPAGRTHLEVKVLARMKGDVANLNNLDRPCEHERDSMSG
jgi:hypothetical protein